MNNIRIAKIWIYGLLAGTAIAVGILLNDPSPFRHVARAALAVIAFYGLVGSCYLVSEPEDEGWF